jgi:4-methyl-5(b-hydroxyethyl)-thiazole monophosphate biosynthesis
MIYVFLANGFEEIEALAPVDFLKRAGIEVVTVGVASKEVVGTHNIKVIADITADEVEFNDSLQGIILPGGMPGAENLNNSSLVQGAIDYCAQNNKIIAAICAAPFILGRKGLLKGKNAICFPGFENELEGATLTDKGVVVDGMLVTAKGAGVAWEFGAAVCSIIKGEEKALEILRGIQWRK